MSGQTAAVSYDEPLTAADQIIAAFHHALDWGQVDIAKRLLAILENMLARRKADGHKEVEKLYVEIAIAKAALVKTPEGVRRGV